MCFPSLAVVAVSVVLQPQTAVLTGRVIDATESAVPGATVQISGDTISARSVSDREGRFRIEGLLGGAYKLTVSLAGFRSHTATIRVDSSPVPELLVRLTTMVLSEVL